MQTLKNQITSERIGHVYPFCGTRGTGKTSITKIFARTVNCEHLVDSSPYSECPTCRSIQLGSPMNVVKIDTASNNDMENMRGIREQVQCPPTERWCRVYIVDEAHMLSIGTFNVLLETLEEPLSYVIFILTTTEVHKILVTTLSRCQHYDFKRISLETTADRLRELIQTEQIQIENRALLYMARTADGSLRGTLSLLDQCAAFHCKRMLTYGNALKIPGTMDSSMLSQMFSIIVEGRTGGCIRSLEEIMIQSRELNQFVADFVQYMRNLLLIRSADDAEGPVDISEENLKRLRNNTGKADGITLMRHIRISSGLSDQLRYASQKWVLVEMALIKLIHPSMEPNLDATLQRLGDLEAQMEDLEAGRMTISVTAAYQAAGSPPAGQVPQAGADPGRDGGATLQTAAPYAPGFQAEPGVMLEEVALPRAQLEDLKLMRNEWAKIVRSMGGGARSYLRDAVVEPDGEDCLIIVFMDPMNYDMGKRPTVTGELERYVRANFSRSVYLKARPAGRDECFNMICVTREELEEEIHMDITYEDE